MCKFIDAISDMGDARRTQANAMIEFSNSISGKGPNGKDARDRR